MRGPVTVKRNLLAIVCDWFGGPTNGRQDRPPVPKAPFPSSQLCFWQGSEAVKGGVVCRRREPLTDSLPCVESKVQGKGARGLRGFSPWRSMRQRLMRAPRALTPIPLLLLHALCMSFCRLTTSAPLSPCFHPHSAGRLGRGAHWCSTFRGCCHLSDDLQGSSRLAPHDLPRPRSHPNSALSHISRMQSFSNPSCHCLGWHLRLGCLHRLALVQRIVHFSIGPQFVQQHRQFARHRYHRSPLGVLAPTAHFAQPPGS
jgi:hypothetical protein